MNAEALRWQRSGGRRPRRGMVSLLAMLFVMVFITLALGFYAQTLTAAQLAANERHASAALIAADSGMCLMRHQLNQLATAHVPEPQLLTEVANGLSNLMNDTGNLGYGLQKVSMTPTGDAVLVPKDSNAMIPLGNGTGFRCKIVRTGRSLVVKVAGYSGGTSTASSKGVEYRFEPREIPAPLFDYGIASAGQITIENKVSIAGNPDTALGSVLSASTANPAVTMLGSASVSGEVTLSNPSGAVDMGAGSSVAGKTGPVAAAPHIRKGVAAPEFPVPDSSAFWPYVLKADGTPNFYNSGTMGNTMTNVVIPPGVYTFNSGVVIKGVVYIQTPCSIKFNGSATIQGAVVVENDAKGALAQNALEFQGGVSFTGIETLPATAQFPAGLRALSGTLVAAKGASVEFGGGFGTVGASIFASKVTFGGNAEGTVAGSIVSLDDNPMVLGSRPITIRKRSTDKWPAGMYFRSYYTPQHGTYREFAPAAEGLAKAN